MTTESGIELHRSIQQKLGRCLLRLQQCEMMMKALVAQSDIAGPVEQLGAVRDEKTACAKTKTMGVLVGALTSTTLTTAGVESSSGAEPPDKGLAWMQLRHQIELPPEAYEPTKQALSELVRLRNELVHQFLARFNIWDEAGGREADAYLDGSFEQIDGHFLTLRTWLKGMQESQALLASFMETSAYRDALDGFWVDGAVDWLASEIVRCLREAEMQFAESGWVQLNHATKWIRKTYPEQVPSRYGCTSWRQVVHLSQAFEVRKDTSAIGTTVWYRSLPKG